MIEKSINSILILLIAIISLGVQSKTPKKSVTKNNMTVTWHYNLDRIYFKMTAPTNGWVTIGFNNTKSIAGNYLLMGRVVNNKVEVVEHHTISAGNYKPITTLGGEVMVKDVNGFEENTKTTILFSLPLNPNTTYQKNLNQDVKQTLLLAYSREDDFQHHSLMRTSINVKL